MKTGLQVLKERKFDILKGKNIALLCHAASVDEDYNFIYDILLENDIKVSVVFSPEHGLKSSAQDMESVNNEVFKTKTITLYGDNYDSLFPKKEQLKDIDIVLIDLQDIGSRYYTYVYTASFFLKTAKELKTKVVVLDRPNPLGRSVEGNGIEEGFNSFVGFYPYFPNRHGLTIGEILNFLNKDINCDLEIIKIENYDGSDFFTSPYPWVLPSPNMPTVETAFLYPGACLIEGTELSEGRGTTKPFHFVGAPYINSTKLKKIMDSYDFKYVKFRDIGFKPMFQKYANEVCNGLEIHITDHKNIKPLKVYLTLIYEIYHNFKEFEWRKREYEFVKNPIAIDLLFGTDKVRNMIESGKPVEEIYNFIVKDEDIYKNKIKNYLLY